MSDLDTDIYLIDGYIPEWVIGDSKDGAIDCNQLRFKLDPQGYIMSRKWANAVGKKRL